MNTAETIPPAPVSPSGAAPPVPPGRSPSSLPPSLKEKLKLWSSSPLPAVAFSGALAVIPFVRPPVTYVGSKAAFQRNIASISPYPKNISVLLFGSFVGLGSFMIYDHDVENGSGLVSAWSLLYALANGKRSMRTLRIYPKFLALFALANSAVYGAKFLNIF